MAQKIWMKRVLIPLWVIQLLALIVLCIAESLALWVVQSAQDDGAFKGDKLDGIGTRLNAVIAVMLAFTIGTILQDLAEVILAAMHRLEPTTYITMQSIKTLVWTVFFVLVVIGAATSNSSGLLIFLQLMIFTTSLAQLIYGSVIIHRSRKGTLNKNSTSGPETDHVEPYFAGSSYPTPQYKTPVGGTGYYSNGAYEMQSGPMKQ